MELTVKGVIADPTEYSLECRLFPRTNWDDTLVATTTNWFNEFCDTDIDRATNVATCTCRGTGYVAIFQSKSESNERQNYELILSEFWQNSHETEQDPFDIRETGYASARSLQS